MTDPRPRPQYGEYAPIDPSRVIPPQREIVEQAPPLTPTEGPAPAPRKTWDVALTTVLLLFGVYSVASSFGEIGSLGTVLGQFFEIQGIGKFTSFELATQVGIAMNVVQAVLLAITIVISLMLIARKKLSFYVPIAGAVVTSIVFTVCIAIVMIGDPAFAAYIGQ